MILHGNQRGGAKNLAQHLLKDENEHVELHELRGFISDDLPSALNEAYAISKATKAKQFLFSLSLNPPKKENVATEDFEAAINQVEEKLKLSGQPRAIVFHEKEGRRHAHAVWSRIDTAQMKAINLPYYKRKLRGVSQELFIEHGWQMPRGLINPAERSPDNFTMAQWQQAKRIGKDRRQIKNTFRQCWAASDDKTSFESALKKQGYWLARGDKRGYVALDHRCEVYAIARWAGIKTKEVRARLGDADHQPSVAQTKELIAKQMTEQLTKLREHQGEAIKGREQLISSKLRQLAQLHRQNREKQQHAQKQRWQKEVQHRQNRLRKGLRGLLDRVTGRHRRTVQRNEQEALQAQKRDQAEKDQLIFKQADRRQALQRRMERLQQFKEKRTQTMDHDLQQYKNISQQKQELFNLRKTRQKSQQPVQGPKLEH